MGIRTYLKSLGGRAGNKTRSRGKVNTWRNKRAASKRVREEDQFKKEVAWNQIDDLDNLGEFLDEEWWH